MLQSVHLEEGVEFPEVFGAEVEQGFALPDQRTFWHRTALLQNALLSFVLHLVVISVLVSVPKSANSPRSPFLEVHLVMLGSGEVSGSDGGEAEGGGPAVGAPGAENPAATDCLPPEPPPPPIVKPREETPDPSSTHVVPRPRVVSKPTEPPKAPTPRRETRLADPSPSTLPPSGETLGVGNATPGSNIEGTGEGGYGTAAGSNGEGLHPGRGGGPIDAEFGAANGPRFVHKSLPKYPQLAQQQGKEGTVVLRVTIDEGGRPILVEVVKAAGAVFDDEAIRAVKASLFHPAKREGKLVACRALLPVRFQLRGPD